MTRIFSVCFHPFQLNVTITVVKRPCRGVVRGTTVWNCRQRQALADCFHFHVGPNLLCFQDINILAVHTQETYLWFYTEYVCKYTLTGLSISCSKHFKPLLADNLLQYCFHLFNSRKQDFIHKLKSLTSDKAFYTPLKPQWHLNFSAKTKNCVKPTRYNLVQIF